MRTKMYRCKRSCMPEKCKVEAEAEVEVKVTCENVRGLFRMTMMIADAEHVFTSEDTSSKEGSVLTIAKSSYEGATEAVSVVVGVESCSEPMVDEGIFFDFDFVG
jgi:hypothetical protein